MPKIKLSASGKVVTKDGKPSCACCGTTLYVEHVLAPWNGGGVSYFTLTGSVGSGFAGAGPGGEFTLAYNVALGRWDFTDPVYGPGSKGSGAPTDPAGYYIASNSYFMPDYTATVSLTPLP